MLHYFNLITKIDIDVYHQTILNLSGTLLGLGFAAFIYILQDGFRSFKFSRSLFLNLYISSGKKILYTLSYVAFICIVRLFLIDDEKFYLITHLLFGIIFIKTILDYQSNVGYLVTLNSKKFIPSKYGKIKAYFRKIWNAGIGSLLVIVFQIILFVILPVIISLSEKYSFGMTKNGEIISITLFLLFAIQYLARFIPNFLKISVREFEVSNKSENPTYDTIADIDIDFEKEKILLKEYLQARGFLFDNVLSTGAIQGGKTSIFFQQENNAEAWFNIMIENPKGSPEQIRRAVERFSVSLFQALRESKCDINSFVQSFHITTEGKNRNIFIRLTRSELIELDRDETNPRQYISKIKNKLFDDLYRDL